ncbi:hypothetical protein BC940DRAFT_117507 [Gongronella butleri]|nr:hypothetical protein BC940DRAFT_117507 [Gongronella butleri]
MARWSQTAPLIVLACRPHAPIAACLGRPSKLTQTNQRQQREKLVPACQDHEKYSPSQPNLLDTFALPRCSLTLQCPHDAIHPKKNKVRPHFIVGTNGNVLASLIRNGKNALKCEQKWLLGMLLPHHPSYSLLKKNHQTRLQTSVHLLPEHVEKIGDRQKKGGVEESSHWAKRSNIR